MRDPEFEMESVTGSSYSARFRADADLDWFRGHFEGLPVLPGIAQVYFVTLALGKISAAAGRDLRIAGFRQVTGSGAGWSRGVAGGAGAADGGQEEGAVRLRAALGVVGSEGRAARAGGAA